LRLRRAHRDQVVPIPAYLDALLPDDHLARLLWLTVERLDFRAFAVGLKVREGGPGRAAADPRLLAALWLYATSQGVTSARELGDLCVSHVAYIWLCGGVSMNYHSLSDFRVAHAAALDELMTQALGRLHAAGLVEFDHVAQDGIRVRASAGAASFHRQRTLARSLSEAQQMLAAVAAQTEPPGGAAVSARQQAARERAARERVARLEAALAALPPGPPRDRPAAEEGADAPSAPPAAAEGAVAPPAAPPTRRKEPRVSSTDAEARVMKMADGGFRPAYNIQFVADTAELVIVGVGVSTCGSDMNQAPALVEQVAERLGGLPADWLMDGGFASKATLETLTAQGLTVYAPVQQPKDPARDPHQAVAGDSPVVGEWRERMGTAAAQALYKLRASTIECVNAQARARHGLQQLRVRGSRKVRCVATWIALTHNLLIGIRHGLEPVGAAIAA